MSNSFIIYSSRAKSNIHAMAEKAKSNNLIFRPHFKTHQNLQIANWFREEGIGRITVSSIEMAKFFMADGWDDITIAFPVDVNEIEEIDELASQISLQVIVSNLRQINHLSRLINRVGVMIEIDVGYHRSGIDFEELVLVDEMIDEIFKQPTLFFMGLLSHFGNSYQARNKEQIKGTGLKSIHRMLMLKNKLVKEKGIVIFVSIGDTPTASILDKFDGVDELRPGNFVFYDLMQFQIGSCSLDQIASVMRCAVIDKKPKEQQMIIHGGAVHFSKEISDFGGIKSYGRVVNTTAEKWILSNSFISNLSQEHGIIQCDENDYNLFEIGDFVDIIPVHSCLTANLMKGKLEFI